MLTTVLMSLLVPLGAKTIPGAPVLGPLGLRADPPIEIWLNKNDRLDFGDRVRVYARADEDGYLLVLHAEPGGRIRVLFPLDPADDHFIRAGETYEIRGRGDRSAFQVLESSGSGAVFAAFSRDPFRFDALVRRDHWDYTLDTWAVGDDAEGDLVRLADLLAGETAYEYDLVRYEVSRYVAHGRYGRRLGLYVGSSYGHSWFGVSWGDPYYSSWYYEPYYYRPYYYRYAWYYDPFYQPFFPFWYDACWYGPCYYRAHYYGWYSHRYYYHYPRDYYWNRSSYRDGVGRYTFKGSAVPRTIEPRSRAPLAGAVTRRLLSPEENRGGSIGRRTVGVNTVSQSPVNGGRRVFTNPDQGTPTRATPRRAAEPTRQGAGTARQPGRTITPTTPAQPQADPGRRTVQDPRRLTPDAREPVYDGQDALRRELERQELRDRMRQQRPQDARTLTDPRRDQGQARPPAARERPQSETRAQPRPRLERREPQRDPPRSVQPSREPTRRAEPRSSPPPRAEPRSAPPRRAEPRSAPPPRAKPRSSPPPRMSAPPRSAPPPRLSAPSRPSSPPARSSPPPRSGGSSGGVRRRG